MDIPVLVGAISDCQAVFEYAKGTEKATGQVEYAQGRPKWRHDSEKGRKQSDWTTSKITVEVGKKRERTSPLQAEI